MEDVQGNTFNLTLPSGRIITIREQNGDDEEKLSQASPHPIATSLHIFLARVIILDQTTQTKPMVEDILKWGIRDTYYALFKSRQFSIGNTAKIKHDCSRRTCSHYQEWEEDLSVFDQDIAGIFSAAVTPDPSDLKIQPYPHRQDKEIILELDSKRTVKYNILDAHGEKYFVDLTDLKRSTNSMFLARQLMEQKEGKWELVTSFRNFTSKELSQIRGSIVTNDSPFTPLVKLTCPKCGNKEYVNIMDQPDFFIPTGY